MVWRGRRPNNESHLRSGLFNNEAKAEQKTEFAYMQSDNLIKIQCPSCIWGIFKSMKITDVAGLDYSSE